MIGETRIQRRLRRKNRTGLIATVRRLFISRDGAVGTEYGFLLAFIGLVAAVGFVSAGSGLVSYFDGVSRVVETTATDMPNPLGGIPGVAPPADPLPPGGGNPPGGGKPPKK